MSYLNQKVIFSTSEKATPLLNQAVNPLPNGAEKFSSSEAVNPTLSRAVTSSRSQANKPPPSPAVTTSQVQTLTPLPSQAVTSSLGLTVTTLVSQRATPSSNHVVTPSLSQAVSLSRSCSDIRNRFPDAKNGEYILYDNNNSSFSTYCHFETKFTWTLVMSYAFAKKHVLPFNSPSHKIIPVMVPTTTFACPWNR